MTPCLIVRDFFSSIGIVRWNLACLPILVTAATNSDSTISSLCTVLEKSLLFSDLVDAIGVWISLACIEAVYEWALTIVIKLIVLLKLI